MMNMKTTRNYSGDCGSQGDQSPVPLPIYMPGNDPNTTTKEIYKWLTAWQSPLDLPLSGVYGCHQVTLLCRPFGIEIQRNLSKLCHLS